MDSIYGLNDHDQTINFIEFVIKVGNGKFSGKDMERMFKEAEAALKHAQGAKDYVLQVLEYNGEMDAKDKQAAWNYAVGSSTDQEHARWLEEVDKPIKSDFDTIPWELCSPEPVT